MDARTPSNSDLPETLSGASSTQKFNPEGAPVTQESDPEKDRRMRALFELMPHVLHKLKNSILVLHGMSDLLAGSERDPKRSENLHLIAEQARDLDSQLQRMAEFASCSSLGERGADAVRSLDQALLLVKPLAMAREVSVSSHPVAQSIAAQCDSRTLFQVLVNWLVEHLLLCGPGGIWGGLEAEPNPNGELPKSVLRVRMFERNSRVVFRITCSNPGGLPPNISATGLNLAREPRVHLLPGALSSQFELNALTLE